MTLTPERSSDHSARTAGNSPQTSGHPLLADEEWADLSRFAPEVTSSITQLMSLKDELRTFDRPMGPDQAIMLADGVEAITRINDALSTLALSVCERVGTPSDFGAKSTKSLIENRFNLTGAEANRRTDMAKNLGGRVDMAGQALPPLYPVVADALHAGTISAAQASVIEDCMRKLPTWVSQAVRTDVETRLVDNAPKVRLKDLREIFGKLMGYIDPDGEEPKDSGDRSAYNMSMRARANGDWELRGLLDPVTGGTLNGLLTSRIQAAGEDDSADADKTGADSATGASGIAAVGNPVTVTAASEASSSPLPDKELLEIVDAVLSGDRYDAKRVPEPDLDAARTSGNSAAVPGVGVREDGGFVDVSAEQPSAREWIYERFAGLVTTIDKQRTAAGAPYALVINATAEDLAKGTGHGTTGADNPVPIKELMRNGLNGSLFFHLMSDKAKTMQVATEQRFANRKQLAVITARDRGCTFPGCDAPPGWCDANHVFPWSLGGKTEINNLALLCSYHHHLLDRTDWDTVMLFDGRPAYIPPAAKDPARTPILHARFIADDIIDSLFDK
ncbi:HNH endonuclease signature motif containing protein [Brevibacterium sp. 'Marine']|uniref:HNH endonuclease signature motif containing protein n=1 Tax=Brevibacterium sp. 'Marine' TaxID=2725563 RepID=UPI00145F6C34|nr:HNH endonuclease signature motif containing protein [Brevibacterium sp. 'Marine']